MKQVVRIKQAVRIGLDLPDLDLALFQFLFFILRRVFTGNDNRLGLRLVTDIRG